MKKIIKSVTSKLTIQAAFQNFLARKKSEGRVPQTIEAYRSHINRFIDFCDGQKVYLAEQIDSALIEKYKCSLVDNKAIAQDTRASYLRAVKCFVNYLIEEKEIEAFKIEIFRIPSKMNVSVYTDEEIKKLLNSPWAKSKDFSELRDYTIMQMMLLTGARRATIRDMRVADIDFDNGKISLSHIKRDATFQIREIPMNSDMRAILSKYMRKTNIAAQSEYLFPNVEGNPQFPDTINKRMEKLFATVGVEFRGCHEFRRTYATKTYAALGDIEATRKLMLISDPRVLQRYINPDMASLKESAERLTFVTQIKAPRPLRGSINKKGA